MFLSLDYLYVPAKDIEASVRYYTEQLDGELVWKIHAFNAWVAAIRLSPGGPMVLLADHLHGDIPILIYRVERLETAAAALQARGWAPESGPFEIPNGPCYTFRDPSGVRFAIYENQRPEVDQEFAGRFDTKNGER
jgi:predicted enzyme related to lactoylglutathione lyase